MFVAGDVNRADFDIRLAQFPNRFAIEIAPAAGRSGYFMTRGRHITALGPRDGAPVRSDWPNAVRSAPRRQRREFHSPDAHSVTVEKQGTQVRCLPYVGCVAQVAAPLVDELPIAPQR